MPILSTCPSLWKLVLLKSDLQLTQLKALSKGVFFCAYNEMESVKLNMSTKTSENDNLFQDSKTGKLVEFISQHDKEYAMVRDGAGNISYVTLEQLVPYSKEKGRLSKVSVPQLAVEKEEKLPNTVVPSEDVRLNLNAATAEMIAKRLPGVGYTTAKRIIELRLSLSGERFSNLKQLENIPRVNWEQFIKDDIIFIS